MNEISRTNFNTNNAWGFGGGIGTEITYDNGIVKRYEKRVIGIYPLNHLQGGILNIRMKIMN